MPASQDPRRSRRPVGGQALGRDAEARQPHESTGLYYCTELELLLDAGDCAVPLLPTARLHVTAAVDAALTP